MSHVAFAKTLLVSIWFFDKFKERESHSALFHGRDAMYNLRRWPPEKVLESNVLDINNHKQLTFNFCQQKRNPLLQ